jgi:hypothetical protein
MHSGRFELIPPLRHAGDKTDKLVVSTHLLALFEIIGSAVQLFKALSNISQSEAALGFALKSYGGGSGQRGVYDG